jgi:hypothetical protein
VWQPFADSGQQGLSYGQLAMDGDDVWFIASQGRDTSQGALFLTKTTTTGETLVPVTNVDGPGSQYVGGGSLAVTTSGVLVGFEREDPLPDQGQHPYVRAFDHDGVTMARVPQRVPVVVGGTTIGNMNGLVLTPAADGHARMFTAVSTMTNDVALVDLDATGAPTGTTVATGTPDGDVVTTIATATLANDSTLIAWDHTYSGCGGPNLPARAMTAVVDPTWNVSVPAMLSDQPDRQDMAPVVAAKGGAAYIAWTDITADGSHEWLAPYAGASSAVEVQGAQQIVLADPAHGVTVWTSSNSVNVQPFVNTGSGLTAGELRTYPPVAPSSETYVSLAGAASLGGTRYLLAWNEQRLDNADATRLYATVVDLADPPPPAMPQHAKARVRSRPCI